MKIFLYAIFSLCFISTNFIAQTPRPAPPPPPPPAPLIYSAPENSSIKEFVSDKFGIKADFPGQPEVTEAKTENVEVTKIKVKLKGSNEIIEISDFNFDVENRLGKAEVFEQVKQKYLSDDEAELVSEREVEQNGLSGKEFGFKMFLEFYKVRTFVKGNRIYELIATVTNWHILEKFNTKKAEEFNNEAERFFNSFKIEKSVPSSAKSDNNSGKIELFKTDSKLYDAAEGGFKIYFPAKPDIKTNRMQASFGETDFHIYSLPTVSAYYIVNYFDYPAAVTDQTEVRFISDAQRDLLMSKENKLVSEKDISYKGSYGREYVLTNQGKTIVMRNFFVNQRFFRLITITNGIKGKMPKSLEEKNMRLTERFFNSFEITKIPPPEFSEIKMPEDFGLRFENSVFYSDYFGFSMEISEDWQVLTENESAVLREIGLMALADEDERITLNTEKSLQNSKFLFSAVKQPKDDSDKVNVLMIAAEKMTIPRFLPEAVAEMFLKEFLGKNEEAVGGVNKVKFDGVDFAWVETLDKTDQVKQRIYFANIKNLAFEITFTYETESELKAITEKLNTIRFKKQ